jgi:hypothetical protein
MKPRFKRLYLIAAALLVCGVAAFAGLARYQAASPGAATTSMANMLPQGALLTIESPDFGTLLHEWNASPEQKSWLASDNYSVFSNSRLFGRLNDARAEFESAAKASPRAATNINADFLTQVAGRQSIFAWYDVGNLEFLYISRISSAQSGNLALMKDRASWSTRQAGGTTFYLRKSSSTAPAPDQAADQAAAAQGKARTVAFAVVPDAGGDLLVLATREDLIANALLLVHPAANAPEAVATEPWFMDASAALPPVDHPPALHMVLNLDRLVRLPYFRSYWVQQNISEMKQYRAAVSDLYPYPAGGGFGKQFREYRALLLESPESTTEQAYLSTLAAVVPAAGVHRAIATNDAAVAVTALEEKLLGRIALQTQPDKDAPDPTLDAPQSGSASDLEIRIDTPAPVTSAISNNALAQALKSAGLDAVLTWSSAQPPATRAGLWVPIHSAVALESTAAWNPQTLQSALQQSLRGNLTAANLGIEFHAETVDGQAIYSLTGPKPLFFAALDTTSPSSAPGSVHLCLFADDRDTLLSIVKEAINLRTIEHKQAPVVLTQLAGFDHTSQRAPYARLTSLIDGTNQRSPDSNPRVQPAFFSGNMRSLSDSFAALASESFEERRDGPIVRQSILYQWQNP